MTMTSHNIPDWISASVAVIALIGVGIGGYVSLSNLTTKVNVEQIQTIKNIESLDTYQSFLQEQVDHNNDRITVLEVKTDTIEKGQEKFAKSVDNLTVEIRAMNAILVELKTIQEQKGL